MERTAKRPKNKRWRFVLTALLFAATFLGMIAARTVKADSLPQPTIVDPQSSEFDAANGLVIDRNKNVKPNIHDVKGGGTSFPNDQGLAGIVFKHGTDLSKAEFTVTYADVGSYNGRSVGVDATYFNIQNHHPDNWIQSNLAGTVITDETVFVMAGSTATSSNSLFNGFHYFQTDNFNIKYHFFYTDDKSTVSFGDNAFLTVNSLNGPTNVPDGQNTLGEYTTYVGSNGANAFLTTGSIVMPLENPNAPGTYVFGGSYDKTLTHNGGDGDDSSPAKFTDVLGAKDFTNGSVSFKVTGSDPIFTFGRGNARKTGSNWATVSSATLFNVKPKTPTKDVTSTGSNTSINGQAVKVGDKLTYTISQKLGTLNGDILTRYNPFRFTDSLPNAVTYVSAELYDGSTKVADIPASAISGQNFDYTVPDDINNKLQYLGETVTLKINVTVNQSANGPFDNKAKVYTTAHDIETNTVTNKVILSKIQITKVDAASSDKKLAGATYTVSDASGKVVATVTTDANGVATTGDLTQGTYTIKETKAPAGYSLDSKTYTATIDGTNPIVKVSDAGNQGTVSDTRKQDIPETGSMALAIGIAIIVLGTGGSAYAFNKRKKL